MKADITIDVVYPHPIDRVWTAITSSEGIAAWLMANDFEPVIGHRFTLRTAPAPGFDGVVHCELLELAAPSHMVWSWRGGPIDTTVTFTLDALDSGRTRFRMRQLGFQGLRGQFTRLVLQGGGTRIYRRRLPAYLDHLAGGAAPAEPYDCSGGWRSTLPWNWKKA